MLTKDRIKYLIELVVIIFFFIGVSYFVQTNLDSLTSVFNVGISGMLLYVAIVIIAIVIAPISAVPLIPLASNLWGWILSAVLNIIGWTIGGYIAFVIARRYGVPVIKKFIPIDKIYRLEKMVPKGNVFWGVVFLRMVIPVDILSYALGLFSGISKTRYFLATLIGVSPFAFVFAKLGTVNLYYQITALLVGIGILGIGFFIAYIRHKQKGKKEKNI